MESADRLAFLSDMELLARAYALAALEKLEWQRKAGETVTGKDLQGRLGIIDDHRRLLGRLLNMLSETGVLVPSGDGFVVKVGADDPLSDPSLANPDAFADQLARAHPHGINELGLLRRCGSSLTEVLQGKEDPLGLLFSDEGPSAADLYLKAPASRAANAMLGDVIATAIAALPDDRQLRIIESRGGDGFGYGVHSPAAARRPVRLHLYRHIGRLLYPSRVPPDRVRRLHRIQGLEHRERPCRPGLRFPRLRPRHRCKCAARHPGP